MGYLLVGTLSLTADGAGKHITPLFNGQVLVAQLLRKQKV
jgi:hypothetical protein